MESFDKHRDIRNGRNDRKAIEIPAHKLLDVRDSPGITRQRGGQKDLPHVYQEVGRQKKKGYFCRDR